jgi:hypothetical protein
MRFYRDHQVAHELSNRGASQLQNAFIADREDDRTAALSYFDEAVAFIERTVQQWDVVISSNAALHAFLPGKLRPEFVTQISLLSNQFVASLQKSGNMPNGFTEPYEEVGKILSRGDESAVVSLFAENGAKLLQLKDLNRQVLEVLIQLRPAVEQGELWDTVVAHAFLVEKKKHQLIDLDERYFAALMSHAFYLEAISQSSRAALIASDIPFEECQARRGKADGRYAKTPTPFATNRVEITFNANGEGTMNCQGLGQFPCLGKPNLAYTQDLTVRGVEGEDKFLRKFSNEYQVWMHWAVLIMGNRGIYIHEGPVTLRENGGPTAGCIHVATGDAERIYNWIDGRTRITIEYPWSYRM